MQNDRVSINVEHIKANDTTINEIIMKDYNVNSAFQGGPYENSSISIAHDLSYDGDIYNGYLSNTYSSSTKNLEGNYNCSWNMTMSGSNINTLIIAFDKNLDEYATEIEINGIVYKNSSAEFIYHSISKYNSLTVKFLSWNKPSKQIKILSILISLTTQYNRVSGLSQFSITNKDKNGATPEFGIISQSGSISIIDKRDRLFNLSRMGLLGESNVDIFIGNFRIGKFSTKTEWKYDNNSKVYTVELDDGLTKLQNIKQPTIIELSNISALSVYYTLVDITPVDFDSLDGNTKNFLSNITISKCIKEGDNMWNVWNEFCVGTSTRLAINYSGNAQLRR